MFEVLRTNKLNDLMLPGQIIAGWLLKGGDFEWLKKEYVKMASIFEDSPVIEWIKEDALEKALKKAHEVIDREMQEERQRAAEERQRAVEEHQRGLERFREIVIALVAQRFPKLVRLAKKQVSSIEDQDHLQQAILAISAAQDAPIVAQLLADLDESEEQV